jgi:hypothetical protein
MSLEKKLIRKRFRDACYKRDGFKCATCFMKSSKETADADLEVHHITNPKEMPNGGYVKENGISLCETCHKKAEEFHSTGVSSPGFSPEDLYKIIGSNLATATVASLKL